jgi:DNA-directed RNA polymerase subunit alpha
MEGAAVTAVRIAGAVHEFSTIPNVREDVINILLNLKNLRIKMEGKNREYLQLSVAKPGVVTAADIEEMDGVEIVNKDLVLATLEAGGKLDMEIEVSRGKGYGPAEELAKVQRPSGFIPMDALYSPIVKVHYDVEPARVGQKTDYDRLILEITTDGTLSPARALHRAAVLLSGSLHIFTIEGEEGRVATVSDEQVEETVAAPVATATSKQDDLLNQSIEFIELSSRSINCLKSENIHTVRDLVKMTEGDLNMIKNFGAKSMEEIKARLAEMNLTLGMKF